MHALFVLENEFNFVSATIKGKCKDLSNSVFSQGNCCDCDKPGPQLKSYRNHFKNGLRSQFFESLGSLSEPVYISQTRFLSLEVHIIYSV